MKKILTIAAAIILGTAAAFGEDPTTTWPYIYQDFTEGDIYMSGRQKVIQKMNVHLGHSKLHYLDGATIKELVLKDVVAVVIGADRYVVVDGAAFKVLAANDNAMLLEQSLGDFSALAQTGGAYGSSSASSATMKLSSFDVDSSVGQNHMMLLQSKHDGQILPLTVKYYIHTGDYTCQASRKELDRQFSDRADQWKAWLKAHKIKWNNPSSLAQILEFVKENQ